MDNSKPFKTDFGQAFSAVLERLRHYDADFRRGEE